MSSVACRSFFFAFFLLIAVCASCAQGSVEYAADAAAASRARELVSKMSDAGLAAQVLLTAADGTGSLSPKSSSLLSALPAGGVMLFKYNLDKGVPSALRLTEAIRSAVGGSVPPFIAADQEGGSVHRFGSDATRLPPAVAFGSLPRAKIGPVTEAAAYRSGRELRALGVTLNLAPVAEIADDQSIQFLDDRAYGRDPKIVAEAASGFVIGMRRAGVACVVKHFPGNAAADPHKGKAVLKAEGGDLERRLESFRRVFALARPAAVMVSHVVVSGVDPDRPATLSPAVIDGLLRKKLGYRGLAVSDDLRMRAIASFGLTPERAAPLALAAGIDMVMTWPSDAASLRDAIAEAVSSGALSRERLQEAAARVVSVKIRYGLLDAASAEPSNPESAAAEVSALRKETEEYLKSVGLR